MLCARMRDRHGNTSLAKACSSDPIFFDSGLSVGTRRSSGRFVPLGPLRTAC